MYNIYIYIYHRTHSSINDVLSAMAENVVSEFYFHIKKMPQLLKKKTSSTVLLMTMTLPQGWQKRQIPGGGGDP